MQDPLQNVIRNSVMQCSDDNTNCYLVDDGAVIVYSDSGDDKVVTLQVIAVDIRVQTTMMKSFVLKLSNLLA